MSNYNRRHYGVNKLYVALLKGKSVVSVFAYTKAEATKDLRAKGFKFDQVVKS